MDPRLPLIVHWLVLMAFVWVPKAQLKWVMPLGIAFVVHAAWLLFRTV